MSQVEIKKETTIMQDNRLEMKRGYLAQAKDEIARNLAQHWGALPSNETDHNTAIEVRADAAEIRFEMEEEDYKKRGGRGGECSIPLNAMLLPLRRLLWSYNSVEDALLNSSQGGTETAFFKKELQLFVDRMRAAQSRAVEQLVGAGACNGSKKGDKNHEKDESAGANVCESNEINTLAATESTVNPDAATVAVPKTDETGYRITRLEVENALLLFHEGVTSVQYFFSLNPAKHHLVRILENVANSLEAALLNPA